jgi:hypothetical protein
MIVVHRTCADQKSVHLKRKPHCILQHIMTIAVRCASFSTDPAGRDYRSMSVSPRKRTCSRTRINSAVRLVHVPRLACGPLVALHSSAANP